MLSNESVIVAEVQMHCHPMDGKSTLLFHETTPRAVEDIVGFGFALRQAYSQRLPRRLGFNTGTCSKMETRLRGDFTEEPQIFANRWRVLRLLLHNGNSSPMGAIMLVVHRSDGNKVREHEIDPL